MRRGTAAAVHRPSPSAEDAQSNAARILNRPSRHCRAAVLRGKFLPAASVLGRSAGPEAGRGVSTPPSLPLDSAHPATRKGLLAPFRPQRGSRAGKNLAASLNDFFSVLHLQPLSRCGGSSPRGSGGLTGNFAPEPKTLPLCQGLPLRGTTSPAPEEDVTQRQKGKSGKAVRL